MSRKAMSLKTKIRNMAKEKDISTYDIIIILSRHVETVVLMSHISGNK
ncbi:MAG TPA: hypothetical protein GX527_01890 [Clostridiaceae bacterium]|jgi:hypothetical protein|nr:hypothetical protein [Clostridiaceae bacterium]